LENGELESRVMELKEKIVEDENAL
jgi:hypothetical protein